MKLNVVEVFDSIQGEGKFMVLIVHSFVYLAATMLVRFVIQTLAKLKWC